jgi:hypothetical protein
MSLGAKLNDLNGGRDGVFSAKRSGCNMSSEHTFCFPKAIHHDEKRRRGENNKHAFLAERRLNPYSAGIITH